MKKLNEVWKDAFGYEGILSVSNLGNVKRLPFINKNSYKNPRVYKGGILKPFFCSKKNGIGYAMIEINKKNISIHRLVASTFIKDIEKGQVVNHINGNTSDNLVSNLEVISNLENIRHGKLNREKYTSKKIGVSYYNNNKIRISIMNKGILYQKGGFKTEDEAYFYLCNLRNSLAIKSKY
jgi:hypothetical protein